METMDLERIAERYRAEMVGVFAKLAEMTRSGRLSPKQFLRAQERVYRTDLAAGRD